MSENLDLVRSIYAAWEQGDFFSGSGEWVDPNIEYVIADGPDMGAWSGMDGLIEGAKVILRAWGIGERKQRSSASSDSERVLVLAHFRGRGRTSGLPIDQVSATGANLFHVRNGRVTRLVLYWDRGRAFADLGLAE